MTGGAGHLAAGKSISFPKHKQLMPHPGVFASLVVEYRERWAAVVELTTCSFQGDDRRNRDHADNHVSKFSGEVEKANLRLDFSLNVTGICIIVLDPDVCSEIVIYDKNKAC